jgi:hypothetical protein
MLDRLAAIPGVRAAGASTRLPLRGEDWVSELVDPALQPGDAIANFRFITPDYCKAMGIPLLAGRFFDGHDWDRPVALVSERAARHLWPYDPITPVGMSIALRTTGNPDSVARAIHRVLAAIDPEMALPPARTMTQILDASVASRRFEMRLTVAFGLAALLLAALGVYGVISFGVARRTPEIGIRVARGARPRQIRRMMLLNGLRPVAVGIAAGMAASLAAGRLLAAELYGVAPDDPAALATVAAALGATAVLACWLPARRGTRIDPMQALRFE